MRNTYEKRMICTGREKTEVASNRDVCGLLDEWKVQLSGWVLDIRGKKARTHRRASSTFDHT